MRYFLSAFAVASIALFAFVGTGFADPPGMLFDPVPAHQHFLMTPSGELAAIGPQICGNPQLQRAFNQFHHNVHHSFIPGVGEIHTLGPQDGAPGLHHGVVGLVIVRGC
jgi:hypothetical protein